MRVCIVEDDELLRSLYSELFEQFQIETLMYKNGEEALQHLSNSSNLPDIIVVDYLMPIMDGFLFRKYQLKNEKLKHIPCILVSAYTNTNKNENLMPPFDRYLTKPVAFRVLHETIKEVLFYDSRQMGNLF